MIPDHRDSRAPYVTPAETLIVEELGCLRVLLLREIRHQSLRPDYQQSGDHRTGCKAHDACSADQTSDSRPLFPLLAPRCERDQRKKTELRSERDHATARCRKDKAGAHYQHAASIDRHHLKSYAPHDDRSAGQPYSHLEKSGEMIAVDEWAKSAALPERATDVILTYTNQSNQNAHAENHLDGVLASL